MPLERSKKLKKNGTDWGILASHYVDLILISGKM
jgi:hypothetical protein